MKITEIKTLAIPEIKVIRFARFRDHRGYFTEHYRKSDFAKHADMGFMNNVVFLQSNESLSRKGTIRGMHFQWNPYMGKMVRTLYGRMIDLILDIRKGSPTYGKMIAYEMPADTTAEYCEWIWIPPGFAHGNTFTEESMIEYFCSGEYSQGCEAGISPLAADIDWSLCDPGLKKIFDATASNTDLITDKDRNGHTLASWGESEHANQFVYASLR